MLTIGRTYLLQAELKVVLACSRPSAKRLAWFMPKVPTIENA